MRSVSHVVTIDAKFVLYLLGGQAAHWPRMAFCLDEVRKRRPGQFRIRPIGKAETVTGRRRSWIFNEPKLWQTALGQK